ncbi:hypothetical protein CCP3SC1_530008 [Gammaproteobacteria bacterium]
MGVGERKPSITTQINPIAARQQFMIRKCRSLFTLILFISGVLVNTSVYSTPEQATPIIEKFIWDEDVRPETLQIIVEASGYRIFWWNVRNGLVNRKLPKPSLDENLISLIHSSIRPDLLAFAEYSSKALAAETQNRLAEVYPYHHFEPYNSANTAVGIAIYSRTKLAMELLGHLDWTPPSLESITEKNTYRKSWRLIKDSFTRPLLCLKIVRRDTPFYILPVHLLDPWRILLKRKGVLSTMAEVMGGSDNPLWFQMGYLEDNLRKRFGDDLGRSPFLIFGDFNTPQGSGLSTIGYRRLTKTLKDVIAGNPTTFPAQSSPERKHFPELNLDHGFTNGQLEVSVAEVLPLQGSNHYALYFVLEN